MEFRLNHLLIGRLVIAFCLLGLLVLKGTARADVGRWLRVFTEEGSIIEVDRSSLVLEQDRVIRAEFRTTFLTPESLTGPVPGLYHSRLDSIQFRLGDHRYRVRETRFLDASGRVMSTVASNVWKRIAGRTGTGLFSAATQLHPFGAWKVVSYRYATGEHVSENELPDLKALMGSDMELAWNHVRVANLTCTPLILEPAVMTGEEFSRRLGSSLESMGMRDKVDAIYLRCSHKSKTPASSGPLVLRLRGGIAIEDASNRSLVNNSLSTNFPPTTLILRRPDNRLLMLWDGVFLELERKKNIFMPRYYQ